MKYLFHIIIAFLIFLLSFIAWNHYPHRINSLWDFSSFNVYEYARWGNFLIKTKICNNTDIILESIRSNLAWFSEPLNPESCSQWQTHDLWDFFKYYRQPHLWVYTNQNNIRQFYEIKLTDDMFSKNREYTFYIDALLENKDTKYTRYGKIRYKMTP